MPRRTSRSSRLPRATAFLIVAALVLFAAGEAWYLARTESGRILAARYFGIGDPARVTQLVGKQVRRGLEAVGIPPDSVRPSVLEGDDPTLRWRVGLPPHASLLQVNNAITHALHDRRGEVLSGREQSGREGGQRVNLVVGLPGRPTHEVVLIQAPPEARETDPGGGHLALVLFGFHDNLDRAAEFFRLPNPFAVALAPGADWSPALFRAARERDREVILHLPLEPINYPSLNPGPGTILVTMNRSKIIGLLKRYLDQAGPVTAVANHMGSLATQDMAVMSAVYDELKRRRLPFLHVTPAAGAVCKTLASDLGVMYDEPDVVLDSETRKEKPYALEASWKQVLEASRERGSLVVLVRATPLVLEWLPTALASKTLDGVSLVPLSSILRRPATL